MSWSLPLRIARREALRHRGRSVLTLVMIALPVLAVTSADVLIQTSTLSGAESVDRRMGASAALVSVTEGVGTVEQGPDPDSQVGATTSTDEPVASAEQVSSLLDGARLVELRSSETQVATDKGRAAAETLEVDLTDPAARGLAELTSGRWPRAQGEVVVNQALADKGYAVGDTLDLTSDGAPDDPRIVGIAESSSVHSFPFAAGPLGSLLEPDPTVASWLVDGAPVSWATVQQLNAVGATVASRAVIDDPPPSSQWPDSVYTGDGPDPATVSVVLLIVTMALIEVVLLAGPSFAVGARKQQRSLALLVATGGTPAQARRVVISSALVLGSVAAVLGVVLGIGLAALLVPAIQHFSTSTLGPFDVPWLHLLGIAAFGLLSAFLAALFPAWLASRQDVVAVLAGRRGDRAPSLRSPILGVVLVVVGVLGSAWGATGGGEIAIAASAIPTVLGMILLVPLVLAGVARVSGRLPLPLRYAVRDAARHRTRTVPAVSAVAATVAGVVALGIGVTSDSAENRETYRASLPAGLGVVTSYAQDDDWPALRAVLARELPDATLTDVPGILDGYSDTESTYTQVFVTQDTPLLTSSSNSLGAQLLVSDDALPDGLVGISATDARRAEQGLREGRVTAFYSGTAPTGDEVTVERGVFDPANGDDLGTERVTVPATWVPVPDDWLGPSAVVPSAVADEVGSPATTVAIAVDGTSITEDEESDVNEALATVSAETSLYVERGFRADSEALIVQLVLLGLGGVLVLGGTLTATFLALSDARPDLATLAAVGAAPRTRRAVAAAYAVVVGLVGAVLGAAVGFVPGLAVTWPLTTSGGGSGCVGNDGGITTCAETTIGPFIDVPWLMVLALVVALPLLAALAVGAFSRSRLPLVARLE